MARTQTLRSGRGGRSARKAGQAGGEVARVVGYCRVSTQEQAQSGAGLEGQEAAIRAEAKRRGWKVAGIEVDRGLSGKNIRRPALERALDQLDAGKVDGLVVAKLDRLSRSLVDFVGLMARSQEKGWALIALDLGVDTSTPSGELMAHTLASFAQFERRIIGQRTRDALAVKRAEGVILGRPRTIDDETVGRIVIMRREGWTLAGIARTLTEEGVPTAQGGVRWYPSTVSHVLGYATK